MKEKKKIILKSRLVKLDLKPGDIHDIMKMQDKVLERLYLISNDNYLLEVLNLVVLKEKKYLSPQVKERYLNLYKNNQGSDDTNEYYYGLKLLENAEDEYHLRIIYQILNNETTKKYNINFLAAEIISYTTTEFMANMAYNILTNEELIKLGISSYIAKIIINYQDNEYTMNDYVVRIRELLDTDEKIKTYLKVLSHLKTTLRVFIGHPDESMRNDAKEVDETFNMLLGLVSLEKPENESSKIGIPEYYGGFETKSLTLKDLKFKKRGRK